MNYNSITIIGRIGRDPEWKNVGPGLCKFSVAVSRNFKKGDEWVQETDWFDVSLWGDHGKRMMEKLGKGDLVMATGPFESRKHEDKVYWTLKAQKVVKLEKSEPRPAAVVADDEDPELPW
jgi:single stranded DNA-binding protein